MVDLLTIQTIGVILAAFSFIIAAANTIRISFEEGKKRKIEYTNSALTTLCSEEGWRRYHNLMSWKFEDVEDYRRKYDSMVNPEAYIQRQTFFSQLDSIGYLYRKKILDEETLYNIGGNIAIWGFAKFKPVMDEYRRYPWPKDSFVNIDLLAKDMYKMALGRDPSFRLDADYIKGDAGEIFK
jgi:hypothetical protein